MPHPADKPRGEDIAKALAEAMGLASAPVAAAPAAPVRVAVTPAAGSQLDKREQVNHLVKQLTGLNVREVQFAGTNGYFVSFDDEASAQAALSKFNSESMQPGFDRTFPRSVHLVGRINGQRTIDALSAAVTRAAPMPMVGEHKQPEDSRSLFEKLAQRRLNAMSESDNKMNSAKDAQEKQQWKEVYDRVSDYKSCYRVDRESIDTLAEKLKAEQGSLLKADSDKFGEIWPRTFSTRTIAHSNGTTTNVGERTILPRDFVELERIMNTLPRHSEARRFFRAEFYPQLLRSSGLGAFSPDRPAPSAAEPAPPQSAPGPAAQRTSPVYSRVAPVSAVPTPASRVAPAATGESSVAPILPIASRATR
jgi:hypothetical protein